MVYLFLVKTIGIFAVGWNQNLKISKNGRYIRPFYIRYPAGHKVRYPAGRILGILLNKILDIRYPS